MLDGRVLLGVVVLALLGVLLVVVGLVVVVVVLPEGLTSALERLSLTWLVVVVVLLSMCE